MLRKVASWLGYCCSHASYSFPRKMCGITYVCCLQCGRELFYSWEEMRCGGEKDAQGKRVDEYIRPVHKGRSKTQDLREAAAGR